MKTFAFTVSDKTKLKYLTVITPREILTFDHEINIGNNILYQNLNLEIINWATEIHLNEVLPTFN